ncbi:HPt domain-containing protein (fragment) [Magnetospirillum sp. LM-5]
MGRNEIGRLAHSLKSTSFLLGYQSAAECARRLELAAEAAAPSKISSLIEDLAQSLVPIFQDDSATSFRP